MPKSMYIFSYFWFHIFKNNMQKNEKLFFWFRKQGHILCLMIKIIIKNKKRFRF